MKRDPKEPLLVDFGLRVAELRHRAGITQEELAARLQKATRYVQQIEAGDQNVTLLTLGEIANALSVLPMELLQGSQQ